MALMNKRKKIEATYEMIRAYTNNPSNYWLAISEFIDNSISSYKEENNNSVEGLDIKIKFDFSNETNKKIYIIDNAGGMKEEKLLDSMQPCNKTNKSDSSYNQYGVGMKFGIFWFGEDGEVYSKNKKGTEYYVNFSTSDKDPSQGVELEVEKKESNLIKTKTGTAIIISKIYERRDITSQKGKQDLFMDALGSRYNKLLKDGKMSITVGFFSADNKNKSSGFKNVIPYFNEPFNLEQIYEKSTEVQKKSLYEKLKKEEDKLNDTYKNPSTSNLTKEAIEKFWNNKELSFKEVIIINNKNVELLFSVMNFNKKSKIHYCGLTTYHIDRAINHCPNSIELNTNIPFIKSKSDPKGRWLYGEINLTGVEVPDQNKSKFDWSKNAEKDMSDQLEKIYSQLECVLQIIVNLNEAKKTKIMNEKDLEGVKVQVSNIIKPSLLEVNIEKNESDNGVMVFKINNNIHTKNINIDGRNLIFEVEQISDGDDIFITTEKVERDDNDVYIIKANTNHSFWNPIKNSDNNFVGNILYPLIIILALSNDTYGRNQISKKLDPNQEYEFINIINSIMKDII